MTKTVLGLLVSGLLATAVIAPVVPSALAQDAPKADTRVAAKSDGADDAKVDVKAKRPLTAQQLKLKECGAKWQEEKKAKGVKGREAWDKFRGDCLKS